MHSSSHVEARPCYISATITVRGVRGVENEPVLDQSARDYDDIVMLESPCSTGDEEYRGHRRESTATSSFRECKAKG